MLTPSKSVTCLAAPKRQTNKPLLAARPLAAQLLTAVRCQGQSLTHLLPQRFDDLGNADERPLVQQLCYGTLRWGPRLECLLSLLLTRKIKQRDADLHSLLLLGLYQLLYMRIPAHAAVSETVAAVKQIDKPWARGLVNALLRRCLREQESLVAEVDRHEEGRYAHPQWLIKRLKEQRPEQWQQILVAGNCQPPMTLRVNLKRISRHDYLKKLLAEGIPAEANAVVDSAIELQQAVNVIQLPGFDEGLVSVQDCAAQLAAELLDPKPGERILDACAAPGGKTGHLLERVASIKLLALDSSPERLLSVEENLHRLSLHAELLAADAGHTSAWWDGQLFDRILLDAPCSGTGVIRRHPDIKVLRRLSDIEPLLMQQNRLLEALWPTLRCGGHLLYATCSLLREENDDQIQHFVACHDDARVRSLTQVEGLPWGHQETSGRQILSGEQGMDGFYFSRLEKIAVTGKQS